MWLDYKLKKPVNQKNKNLTNKDLDKFFNKATRIFVTKKEFSGLKKDVSKLKGDVSGLKKDVSKLKGDVSELRQEFNYFRDKSFKTFATKDDLKKFVTKDEFAEFRREILDGQDKMMVILERLDQERVFTLEWVRRIDRQVESQALEITKIKKILKIV